MVANLWPRRAAHQAKWQRSLFVAIGVALSMAAEVGVHGGSVEIVCEEYVNARGRMIPVGIRKEIRRTWPIAE